MYKFQTNRGKKNEENSIDTREFRMGRKNKQKGNIINRSTK